MTFKSVDLETLEREICLLTVFIPQTNPVTGDLSPPKYLHNPSCHGLPTEVTFRKQSCVLPLKLLNQIFRFHPIKLPSCYFEVCFKMLLNYFQVIT